MLSGCDVEERARGSSRPLRLIPAKAVPPMPAERPEQEKLDKLAELAKKAQNDHNQAMAAASVPKGESQWKPELAQAQSKATSIFGRNPVVGFTAGAQQRRRSS